MAFDGITIANIVYDLNRTILNGRIAKIAQPEKDELILTIKGGNIGQALSSALRFRISSVNISDRHK